MNLLDPLIIFPADDVLGSVVKTRLPARIPSFMLISCAAKLPVPSRTTISLATLELDIFANLSLVIVAAVISASTINELDNNPAALLCTTPAVLNPSIVILPDPSIFNLSLPFVSKDNVFAVAAERPVFVLPVNCNDGAAAEPAGSVNVPVNVPPVRGKSNDACPIKLAVMVPAEKLPEPSRTTISFATLELEIAASLALVIVALVMSAFTIKELDNKPVASLCITPAVL